MTKIFSKFFGLIISFLVIWFLLSRVDWVDIFEVKKTTGETEEKIGELYVELIKNNETVITNDSILAPIIKIIDQITEGNDLDLDVKLHVIDNNNINAFAIPDDNLVLYTGLINESQSPEELAGVLGHEIAHMTNNHVMKKLITDVGLSVILSMASGGNGSIIQETFSALTSSAYDRSLESEADLASVELLHNADIDFRPFAEFLYRLSLDEDDRLKHLQLMMSHPASEERAKTILSHIDADEIIARPLMTEDAWLEFKTHF